MNGFFLIDKPKGWTSRDVCNKIAHIIHEKKVGHTGTLDPFATGLLVVTVNKGTKAGSFIEDDDKTYIASLKLGIKTDSGDITGKVIEEKPVNNLSVDIIKETLNSFIGLQKQIPPMTSAIHYNGQKLYQLAREGKEVIREAREITIHSIEFISFENNVLVFKTKVSKGTYIRTLGEDIASKLDTVGHLIDLRRVEVGKLKVEDSINIEKVNENGILSIFNILSKYYQVVELNDTEEKMVKDGKELMFLNKEDILLLINKNKEVIAIYERINNNTYHCSRGLW